MKINTLKLANFQGIRELELSFDGQDVDISGDNATGKTTVANAISWLLYDKASTEEKGFSPKTLDQNGEVHNLEHSVLATFVDDDGNNEIELEKIFKESYVKKRGRSESEFTGHTTDYLIDGVPAKKKEFDSTVEDLFGTLEQMQVLFQPLYFSRSLEWQKRRGILLEMCGDVTEADVLEAMGEDGKFLETAKGKKSVEDYLKVVKSKKTEVGKSIEIMPSRIDEASKAIPDIQGNPNVKDLKKAIADAEKRIEENNQKVAETKAGSDGVFREKTAELKTKMAEEKSAHTVKQAEKNSDVNAKIAELRNELVKEQGNLTMSHNVIKQKEDEIQRMMKLRESLGMEYKKVEAETWQGDETCPTCHQPLPEDQVEQAKETFNINKSNYLEEITARGNKECTKPMIAALKKELKQAQADEQAAKDRSDELTKQVQEAQAGLTEPEPFEATEIYKKLNDELQAVQENSAEQEKLYVDEIAALQDANAKERDSIREKEEVLATQAYADKQKARVAELEAEQKDLASAYEQLEHAMFACEMYIRTKTSMLDDLINNRFSTVKFNLTKEHISGGVEDACDVLVPTEDGSLVPFASANNAARINAGLEIIDELASFWGKSLPVVVDNAESVTKLIDIKPQVIRLVVSAEHPTLTMTHKGSAKK